MLGFKDFHCAARISAGIETVHLIRKRQLACLEGTAMSAAKQLEGLLDSCRHLALPRQVGVIATEPIGLPFSPYCAAPPQCR